MRSMNILFLAALCLTTWLSAQNDPKFESYLAGELAQLSVQGELLYNCANLGGYRFGGGVGATKKTVDVDPSLPFGKALQLAVKQAGVNSWEPQLQSPTNAVALNKGDYLLYVLYLRVLDTDDPLGNGDGYFYAQKAGSPWTGLGSRSLTFAPEWRKLYVVAQATENYPVNSMELTVHLGFRRQTVEIGGIIALYLGANINVDDLPGNPLYWHGMEADAAWRAEAAARIEQHRKGDLVVIVNNQNGQPIKSAQVSVAMQRHAYGFGTFIANLVLQSSANAQKYKAELKDLFNCATTPFYMGDGGWGWYASEHNRQEYRNMAGWLQDNDIPAKGHVLIWPGWTWMPPFFQNYQNDPAGMRDAIDEHLQTVVPIGEEKGLVEWDVVNEPHINHDVMDICGDEIMIDWYKRVHELDPLPRLILNEYNIISSGGLPAFHADFSRYIEMLLNGGAPLGGLGVQCHFDENLTGIPRVLEILDQFGKYGLPIQVTEFDIDTRNIEAQAAYTRDFFTAVFSHPMTDKIVMWGFWEGDMWRPNGALIRRDWSYKPNYHVYNDLVFNQWWTNDDGVSGRDGVFQTRGFCGEYRITVEFDGHTISQTADLTNAGSTVVVQVPTIETGVFDRQVRPAELALSPNYPNPFNPATTLSFRLLEAGRTRLTIYNLAGENVAELVNDDLPAGDHQIEWHAGDRPSGLYLARLQSNDVSQMIKMVLQK